jgi:capsular polysaccharide biosynthesis protein
MEDGETTLRDYLEVLLKWKKLIISITVVALILAVVLNFFIFKPVYRGSAVVYIAQVNNAPLIKPKDVQSQITSDGFLQKIAQDLGVSYTEVKDSIAVSTAQDSKILVVNFDSEDKELIKSFFNYFMSELNSFNNQAYQTQIESYQSQISSLRSQIDSLDKQGEDVLSRLKILEQKGTTNSEYMLEYSQLRGVYDSIISKRVAIAGQITQIQSVINGSNAFFYENQPLILDSPVKPRKAFNIAITLLIAFFLSVLLAFFVEYWRGKETKQEGSKS